jgi:hypothetical protein
MGLLIGVGTGGATSVIRAENLLMHKIRWNMSHDNGVHYVAHQLGSSV